MNNEFIRLSDVVEILWARAEMATGTPKEVFFAAADMLEKLPAVDAVEVVRCSNCDFWAGTHDSLQGKCLLTGEYPTGAWYCANGKIKEAE